MRALRHDYKLYAFEYPSFRGARFAAQALVGELRRLHGPAGVPPRSIVLLGHSLGGLVCRRAMNVDGFGDSVLHAFTLASPHHGTLIASLATADHRLRRVAGDRNYALLRTILGLLVPDGPALEEIAWDDHDGALSRHGLERMGARANPELLAFNAADHYRDRLTVLMGDCPDLRWNPILLPLDYVRAAQGLFGRGFANCDPLVPLASGLFAGGGAQSVVARKVNHADWALRDEVLDDPLERIGDLRWPQSAQWSDVGRVGSGYRKEAVRAGLRGDPPSGHWLAVE